jgi:hypothetical protein
MQSLQGYLYCILVLPCGETGDIDEILNGSPQNSRFRIKYRSMDKILPRRYPVKVCRTALSLAFMAFLSVQSFGQGTAGWKLEKMPADLETDFALSSLPPYVRNDATVYLLDVEKGYYVARQGKNDFICFVLRTQWETGEFRQDLASAISYDAEGAKTIFPVYKDVAVMRASGKFTASQIKDSIATRFATGFYVAPRRPGLSYMLAPVMRSDVGDDKTRRVATFSLPHYMFYAPYVTEANIGGNSPSGGPMILGDGKGPHGYIMVPAGKMEAAEMMKENSLLLKRLIAYKSYFDPGSADMQH